MALVGREIRSIFRSLSAEFVIFWNSNSSSWTSAKSLYFCDVIELIVFIFFDSINIPGNINACLFFRYLKLWVVFILNWVYNGISVLDYLFNRKSLCVAGSAISILSYMPFGICNCTDKTRNLCRFTCRIVGINSHSIISVINRTQVKWIAYHWSRICNLT